MSPRALLALVRLALSQQIDGETDEAREAVLRRAVAKLGAVSPVSDTLLSDALTAAEWAARESDPEAANAANAARELLRALFAIDAVIALERAANDEAMFASKVEVQT